MKQGSYQTLQQSRFVRFSGAISKIDTEVTLKNGPKYQEINDYALSLTSE